MTRRRSSRRRATLGSDVGKDPSQEKRDEGADALPRPRSFVLQLTADAAPSSGAIRGRAVHIASGEAASFESMAELLGFLDASIARAEQGE